MAPIWSHSSDKLNDFMLRINSYSLTLFSCLRPLLGFKTLFASHIDKTILKTGVFNVADCRLWIGNISISIACVLKKITICDYLLELKGPLFIHRLFTQYICMSHGIFLLRLSLISQKYFQLFAIVCISFICLPCVTWAEKRTTLSTKRNHFYFVSHSFALPFAL